MYKNYASVATCTFCNSVFLLLHFLISFGFLERKSREKCVSCSEKEKDNEVNIYF